MPREKTIPCPECGQMFSAQTMLAVHRVSKHPPEGTAAKPAPRAAPAPARAAAERQAPAADHDDDDDVFGAF